MAKGLNQTLDGLSFPISKTAQQTAQKQAAPEQKTSVSDSGLNTRLKEALAVPIIGKDDYWNIEDLSEAAKTGGMLAKLLKKKDLSADEINSLKKDH